MNFAVIGLGTFGRAVAEALGGAGAEVIGIDTSEDIVESIKDDVSQALRLDSTDERAMRAAGLEEVDVAVVAHGENIEVSILTTVILRRLGVPRIVARSVSGLHAEVLGEVGADQVVSVERQQGRQLAEALLHPAMGDRIPLAPDMALAEITPPAEFIGQSLRQLDSRRRYGVNIVAVRRRTEEIGEGGDLRLQEVVDNMPDPDLPLESNDRLLAVGADAALAAFSEARLPEKPR